MKRKLIHILIAISIFCCGLIVEEIIPESYLVDWVFYKNYFHGAITLIPIALMILSLSILLPLYQGRLK